MFTQKEFVQIKSEHLILEKKTNASAIPTFTLQRSRDLRRRVILKQ